MKILNFCFSTEFKGVRSGKTSIFSILDKRQFYNQVSLSRLFRLFLACKDAQKRPFTMSHEH